jgi:GMP synthase (glutamine-hydrolysing)
LRGPIEFNAASSVELPSHGDFDLLLLPGSPLAVYDDLPCVVKMEKWLRDILKRNDHAPIFGICFGHQMIGKCLGGIVEKNPLGVEKGCREIEVKHEVVFLFVF